MITLSKLRRKPRHFRAFTGLTPFEFDALLVELTPIYEAALTQRSQTPDRLRDAGADTAYPEVAGAVTHRIDLPAPLHEPDPALLSL